MILGFFPNSENSGEFEENNRIVATMSVAEFKKKFSFKSLAVGSYSQDGSKFMFDALAKRPVAFLSKGIQDHLTEGGKLADLSLQVLLFVSNEQEDDNAVQALFTRVAEVDLSEETL